MRRAIIAFLLLAACGNSQNRPQDPPAKLGFRVVAEWPHDTGSYTQGLFWHSGALVESTGEYGSSRLRRVDLATGAPTGEIALDDKFFAEGTALVGDKIYQLTWLEGTCFVYDAETFALEKTFTYNGEGWGLATDGALLYMSDGSANITVRDPGSFNVRRTFAVRMAGRPVQYLNELEWIDGRLWANIYKSETVVVIDPASGNVESVIDFSGLLARLAFTPDTDVMNGIAHDPAAKKIFVTGKNWNKLFEVEILK